MSGSAIMETMGRAAAERFLQTVLVIDNELYLAQATVPLAVTALDSPSGSIRRRDKTVVATATVQPPPSVEPPVSPLDVKTIMDAFLRRSLICGMHKPVAGNDLVVEAITAARRSDAVIVDWLLQGTDPTAAQGIIAGIIDGDREERGRLRLIVVYTSEADVDDIVRKIAAKLPTGLFTTTGRGVLEKPDSRIVVLNKERTVGGKDCVSVADMPDRIVKEFALLSRGLLSTFAVSAVAAIRRSTHHMLAVFSSEMDGAFVAHRCALPTPEDATEFALELLGGELRGRAAMDADTLAVLDSESLKRWIRNRVKAGKTEGGAVSLPEDIVLGFVDGGSEAVTRHNDKQKLLVQAKKDAKNARHNGSGQGGKGGQPTAPLEHPLREVSARNLGSLFHESEAILNEMQGRFARLAGFKTEPYGARRPPEKWFPYLSLGTLIVALDGQGVPQSLRYLLCTQPRCDAVRLEERRTFPFQVGVEAAPKTPFNLVAALPGEDGRQVFVLVGSKPHNATTVDFAPTTGKRVTASRDGDGFFFEDINGQRYQWLGDLRDLTAQRTASAVAARMHEVGFDEYEWVRLNSSR